jgi:hypothetical protein
MKQRKTRRDHLRHQMVVVLHSSKPEVQTCHLCEMSTKRVFRCGGRSELEYWREASVGERGPAVSTEW